MDYSQAYKWCLESANQGYALAQFHLGGMYFQGHGTAQNNMEAYIWCKLAEVQDQKYSEMFNKVADILSFEELLEVDSLYKERKEAIQDRQKAAKERDKMHLIYMAPTSAP